MKGKHMKKYGTLCIIAIALILTVQRNAAANCDPNAQMKDLFQVLDGHPELMTSNWGTCLDPTFNSWEVGGSENMPVLSGAIGLNLNGNVAMQPGSVTYVTWWLQYLKSQTGQQIPSQTPRLRYFQSSELTSNIYNGYAVCSVLAVRYWAWKNGNAALRDAAVKWLKVNWAIYGMSAGSGPARWFSVDQFSTSDGTPVPQPMNGQVNASLSFYSNLPYLALPGERSQWADFGDTWRGPLFGRAVAWPNFFYNREEPTQLSLLNWLQAHWTEPSISVYGLTNTERTNLRSLITTGSGASTFLPWLAGVRTINVFRILGWGNTDRVGIMETNKNGNTVPVFGVAFKASNSTAYFLYPWSKDVTGHGGTAGWARLEFAQATASNAVAGYNNMGRLVHPVKVVTMPVPTNTPQFHLVLTPTAEPLLQ